MAADLATLAIQIKTDSVKAATADLHSLDAAGARAEGGVKKVTTATDGLDGSMKRATDGVGRAEGALKRHATATDKLQEATQRATAAMGGMDGASRKGASAIDLFQGALKTALTLAAGYAVFDRMAAGVASVYDAGTRLESLTLSLKAISGSAAGAASQIAYLREVTDRYGLSIQAAADPFRSWTAATAQTALAGDQARKVFESVVNAAGALGMSSEQVSGTLQSLTQMVSKGTVAAEELRGQFGERVPGGFQIAARAMGVTTAKLGEMLERGQIVAEDFLPKLAVEMDKTFGQPVDGAIQATNRLSNEWERLKANLFIPEATRETISFTARIVRDLANDLELFQHFKSGRIGFGDIVFLGGGKEKDDFLKSLNTVESVQKRIAEVQGKINPLTSPYERKDIEAQVQQLQKLAADMEKAAMKDPIAAAMARAEKAREQRSLLSGVTVGQQGQIDQAGIEDAHRAQQEAAKGATAAMRDSERAAKLYGGALDDLQDKIAKLSMTEADYDRFRVAKEYDELARSLGGANDQLDRWRELQLQKIDRDQGLAWAKDIPADPFMERDQRAGKGADSVLKMVQERLKAEEEIKDKLLTLRSSDTENALRNIQTQADAWRKLGVDRGLIEQWATAQAAQYSDDWVAGAQRGLQDYVGSFKSGFKSMSEMAVNTMQTFENTIVQATTTGEVRWSNMVTSMVADLTRLATQKTITGPLAGLFGDALGKWFGAEDTTTYGAQATGPASHASDAAAWGVGLHSGGVVGAEATFMRAVPASVFSSAPRYHSGGIAGDEIPAILRRGEGVFTREQMAALGGAGGNTSVVVNVIDQRSGGGEIQARETQGSDGSRQLEVLVLDAVDKGFARGRFDSSMRAAQRRI